MSRILKNMGWLAAPNALVKPLWFIFITYVCIRFMGLEQYGVLTAALALMSICDGSLNLGTSVYTVREVARQRDRSELFFSNLLVARMVLSLVAVATGLGIRWMLGTGAMDVVLFAGTYVFFRNLLEYCRALFQSHELFHVEAASTVLEKVLVVAGGSWALLLEPDAAAGLLGMSAGMALTFAGTLVWTTRRLTAVRFDLISWDFYRKALPHALPLGLSSLFVLLYYRTDSIMLETMEGALVTGQYGLAFRITEAMILLPYIATVVLLPRMSALFESDAKAFSRLFRRGLWGTAGAAAMAAAVVWALAPWIIGLLDGSADAEPSVGLLRVLLLSFVLNSINQIGTTHLTATHQQNRLAIVLAAAAVANIVLNLLLIPDFSAAGAAWATVITQVLILAGFLPALRRPSGTHASAS
ncbi:MAG: flippase [Bacteroidetes bacterium]|nr:flippase [Bacteroidota bacterium]MDA0874358.1 flippase [Bacteroidota bacterium]